MPRYAVPITREELIQKLVDKGIISFDDRYGYGESWEISCWNYDSDEDEECYTPKMWKDLAKVNFDHENQLFGVNNTMEQSCQMLDNGVPVFWVYAGGDWEYGVYYAIYWSGTELRCYIPKLGNTWNIKTKTAQGSESESRRVASADWWGGFETEEEAREAYRQNLISQIDPRMDREEVIAIINRASYENASIYQGYRDNRWRYTDDQLSEIVQDDNAITENWALMIQDINNRIQIRS